MRALLKTGMRPKLAVSLVTAAIGVAAFALPATAADVAVPFNATPVPRVVVQQYADSDSYYRPVCPYRYAYSCRYDPDGVPHCACWPGLGFFLFGID
jgi:hypothetical protein